MRIRDLYESQSLDATKQDLNDLLVAAKASKIEKIAITKIVSQMNSMGHMLSNDSIISLIADNTLIADSDATHLYFVAKQEDTGTDGDQVDSEEKVSNMAAKSAMKSIKS